VARAGRCTGHRAARRALIDGSGAAPESNVTIVIENGRLRDIA